jgi:glycosyltransferase involved in cell wall biosynthesis
MRLAILGTRGVPARYGGFETFAEELGARLAERGHEITVYGRSQWIKRGQSVHRGMEIVRLPAPRSKYLETVVHTIFSAVHSMRGTWDAIYVCNLANVPAALLLRAAGHTVILNVDGLEWERDKWSSLGRQYYRACAWLATRAPIELVTDAHVIQRFYESRYGRSTRYFAYGADLEPVADNGLLAKLRLKPGRYVLYVSRLEPENNAQLVVDAFRDVDTDVTLALVGDAPYASQYIRRLKDSAARDRRVVLLGAHYGRAYGVLRSHAAAYVQATEVGGTHPALVEAMGFGNAIAANDVPEHREVLGDAGLYYTGTDGLTAALQSLLSDTELNADLRRRAAARARSLYSWDDVADGYEEWLVDLTSYAREASAA